MLQIAHPAGNDLSPAAVQTGAEPKGGVKHKPWKHSISKESFCDWVYQTGASHPVAPHCFQRLGHCVPLFFTAFGGKIQAARHAGGRWLAEKLRALKTIAVEFQRMYKGFQERPFFDFRSRNLGPEHRRILEMMILFVFINSILFKLSATGGRQ